MPLAQLAITATVAVYFGIVEDSGLKDIAISWVVLSIFSTAIAYIATILIGLPVHLWLERRKLSTIRNHAAAGVFSGLVAALTIILPQSTVSYLGYAPVVFLSSLVVAFTFGVLVVSRKQKSAQA